MSSRNERAETPVRLSAREAGLMPGRSLYMLLCCTVMVAGAGILFARAPAEQSFAKTVLLTAPLFGCVIMHFVMHRMMGRPCHAHEGKEQEND